MSEKASVGQAIHVLTQNRTPMNMLFTLSKRFHLGLLQILLSLCRSNVICTNLYLHQDSHNLIHPSAVTMSDILPRLPKLSSLFCFDRLPRLLAPGSRHMD